MLKKCMFFSLADPPHKLLIFCITAEHTDCLTVDAEGPLI